MRLRKRLYRRLKKVLRVHRAQRSWVDASPHKPHAPPTPTPQPEPEPEPEPAPTQADPAPTSSSDDPLSAEAQQTITELLNASNIAAQAARQTSSAAYELNAMATQLSDAVAAFRT